MEPAKNPIIPPPPPSNRLWESACVAANLGLCAWLAMILWRNPPAWSWQLAAVLVGTWLLADFISGTVHWFADTWGRSDWPILGPTLIHSFREHHVLPEKIITHGWVETNGACCMISLPVLVVPAALGWEGVSVAGCLSFTVWIVLTNQIHKWAHATDPGWVVRTVGRTGLVLSRENHARHHSGDHTTDYAITSGVLNRGLDYFGVYRKLESVITAATGWKPREDDRAWIKRGKG